MSETPGPLCRLRPLLGTFVAIEIPGDSPGATAAIETAYSAISRVEELMHPERAGSDLARIGAAAPGQSITVDPWTFEVLRLAQRLHRESSGAFDPCLPSAPARMRDVELRDLRVTCRLPVALDLGGIAKGFAVDRAVEVLQQRGAVSGLVNAGGDLRLFGSAPRTIHVRAEDGAALAISMQEGALAVSGPLGDVSPTGHRGFYHRDGGLPLERMTVAILAPTAALADALCKCALLCEPALLDRLLETHHAQRVRTDHGGG
jgi:thiamine biosynthesis lipoprotein